ncbi:hypothetical protein G6R40_10415 [Chryseobacterium sp. POL2]|uniref:hypothetical protein n=1 Tax=Chryseobacterium sp. POL2 TaxID=2713414 RepID=UPI0013E179C3|nr:hypothetical protein [Chryseobacterium sp. POL2]QIG90048.1 hypothetical protein G6R40_10415 [Chryseobacterium sp. POL2]
MEKTPNTSDINLVLSRAFNLWSSTLKFQISFSLFYFAILFALASFAFNYFGINEKVEAFAPLLQSNPDAFMEKMKELAVTEEYSNFMFALIVIKAIVFPLNIGMLNIFAVKESGKDPLLSDLLVGYQGINFFKYFTYGIFWGSVYYLSSIFAPLLLVWVLVSFFVSPIMFFLNQSSFKAISLGFAALKTNFILIFVCTLVAIAFSYSGLLMFGFGFLLTFPFWNAIIYACFRHVFVVKA